MIRNALALTALLSLPTAGLLAQPSELTRLFEAGQYQQVIERGGADPAPDVLYLVAQSQLKLGAIEQATASFGQLAARSAVDPWHFIGLSGQQLAAGDTDAALASARQAVDTTSSLLESQFQLGLVLARRQEWTDAAKAFEAAATLRPSNAYAHYYCGLMDSRIDDTERMAAHLHQFLTLAPDAPERPEVTQIMRSAGFQ